MTVGSRPIPIASEQLQPEPVPIRIWLGFGAMCALIDTAIWLRAPEHVDSIVQRLLAGDRATALFVGLPPERFLGKPLGPVDADTQEFARPLVERAGLVSAINEAWAMMAVAMALALIGILVCAGRKPRR